MFGRPVIARNREAMHSSSRPRRLPGVTPTLALGGVLAGMLCSAPAALAHAQLLGTSPASGSTVATQPQEVIFEFNQNVGGTLGAVRVYDAQGNEVDDLDVSHPDGNEHWMGVGLKPGLPDGTYTAHLPGDLGRHAHRLRRPGVQHRPRRSRAEVHGRRPDRPQQQRRGHRDRLRRRARPRLPDDRAAARRSRVPAPRVAARVRRRSPAPSHSGSAAARTFAGRMRLLLIVAVVLGVVVSVLGILLQGASAAGVSLWASLKRTVVQNTLKAASGRCGACERSTGCCWASC